MFDKILAASFSVYCSLILTSALMSAAPQSYQAAAMALPDAALQTVRRAGWNVAADAAPAAIPDATPRTVSASASSQDETGPLSKVADYVFQNGLDAGLNGQLSTAIGVTQNNERFQVRQTLIDTPQNIQTLNVSRVRGRVDVLIFYRTANEGTVYLTSLQGDLEKAIHIVKGQGVEVLRLDVAKADFEREKAWWIGQVGTLESVASQP